MIIVTGATGKLGSQIVRQLLTKYPASYIGATARDPGKAHDLTRRGVRVRHGDFALPESLSIAMEGASQVLIVSSNAESYGGDALAQHRAAIAAAKAAGARRITYTSHMAASATSAFSPMHSHAATEAMLREAGVPWTALRNGFYASTVATMIGNAATTDTIIAPADGPVSWTAHRDLAAAAVAVLIDEGRFNGPTPPLTASKALNLADVAAILSEIHGKSIARQIIADADQVSKLERHGVSTQVIKITMGMYEAARAGEFAAADPALRRLLGCEPIPLRDLLAERKEVGPT